MRQDIADGQCSDYQFLLQVQERQKLMMIPHLIDYKLFLKCNYYNSFKCKMSEHATIVCAFVVS